MHSRLGDLRGKKMREEGDLYFDQEFFQLARFIRYILEGMFYMIACIAILFHVIGVCFYDKEKSYTSMLCDTNSLNRVEGNC